MTQATPEMTISQIKQLASETGIELNSTLKDDIIEEYNKKYTELTETDLEEIEFPDDETDDSDDLDEEFNRRAIHYNNGNHWWSFKSEDLKNSHKKLVDKLGFFIDLRKPSTKTEKKPKTLSFAEKIGKLVQEGLAPNTDFELTEDAVHAKFNEVFADAPKDDSVYSTDQDFIKTYDVERLVFYVLHALEDGYLDYEDAYEILRL